MKSMHRKYLWVFAAILMAFTSVAQTTISGKVKDAKTGEELIGVNILVKGTVLGTITDVNGDFNLKVNSNPPITLVISSVGYNRIELPIENSNVSGLEIELEESLLLGQEVVVSASRVEESIMQSPVSIAKMDILDVQNTSADTYYKAIANLKGVDVATSSINFQIINARGFGNTGNTRFVQLIDGMDTQAPALNFPIGNLNGPSQLDVESVELIPGAASALYGPNAFNGVLLINSKNAFDYQGLSAYTKVGVNHIATDYGQPASPMYEASIRYAKAFNNKFAFKVNGSYSRAEDWHGVSRFDRNLNPFASIGEDNPGADRLHLHGDEAGINMNIFRFSRNSPTGLGWEAIATTGSGVFSGNNGTFTAWRYAQNGFLPNHVITAPGYEEERIVDYGAENMKVNTGLYYRINDKMELSYLYNAGFGTSIYTGAQRYSLANFGIQQHRLQLRGDNFLVRAYTTLENSGDSYIAEFLALKMNEQRLGDLSSYFGDYGVQYLRGLYNQGITPANSAPGDVNLQQQYAAHQFAQQQLGNNPNYALPESGLDGLKSDNLTGTIPDGPFFADQSNLYHGEFQYDFKNEIDWMELQVGGNVRQFELNSQGTIFPDTAGSITINEFGGYLQGGKKVTDDFKLSGSVRFDKNENFNGQVNPRISGVYTVADNHNFRLGLQTGFRNPTTQGQYISLDVISARLLGGLPQFYEFYDLARTSSTGVPIAYKAGSVRAFRSELFETGKDPFDPSATALLETFTQEDVQPVQPERIRSIEAGYRSLIDNRLMVDFVYYYNIYESFITQIQVSIASELTSASAASANASGGTDVYEAGDPAYNSLLSGSSANTFQIYTNLDNQVRTQGASLGLTYSFDGGYKLGGNYNWNQFIGGYDENTLQDFNTPEHKFNINFGNRKLTDNLGFNITYRYQTGFTWESSFAIGDVPAYNTVDAQVSYRIPDLKSVIKLGGSNILNTYYIQSLGGPEIGAIYYISITFDELMN